MEKNRKALSFCFISIPLFLLLLFLSESIIGAENDEDDILNLLSRIENTISRKDGFKQHNLRMKTWKKNVYESEILLDKLLEKSGKLEESSEKREFPGEDPFREISDKQWKIFRFLNKYRNFIFNTINEIVKNKSKKVKTLSGRIVVMTDSFRRDAYLGKGGDIEKIYKIQKHVNELEEQVKRAGSIDAIKEILQGEIKSTQRAYLDLKEITENIKVLNRQFRMIRKYYETGSSKPRPLNPQPPTDYVDETPTPEFTPLKTHTTIETPKLTFTRKPASAYTPRHTLKPTSKYSSSPKPRLSPSLKTAKMWGKVLREYSVSPTRIMPF